jgi:flagellar biosynthesis/type III secretory pathway ATPase
VAFDLSSSSCRAKRCLYSKAILDVGSLMLHDITALSGADSPVQSDRVRTLFFQKWEVHEVEAVRTLVAHFKRVWCNVRVGNWTHGHIANYVNCTNGLEAMNKVLKDEMTNRQLMPIQRTI